MNKTSKGHKVSEWDKQKFSQFEFKNKRYFKNPPLHLCSQIWGPILIGQQGMEQTVHWLSMGGGAGAVAGGGESS